MIQPEWISGNIYIRPNYLDSVGDRVKGHRHNFDHTTIVFKGAVHVKAKDSKGTVKEKNFEAGTHFLVRADTEHEITATEEGTVFWCVYSHRDPQARITQYYDGWDKAYI